MTIAVYMRVSTMEQSVRSQKAEIRRWLDGHGIEDSGVQWFQDKASGETQDRPAFEKLKRAIFEGTVKTVVVQRLDRLSRNLRDGLNTLIDWTERGIRVVSVTQQIDLSGTVGKMIASVLLGVSQMETEIRRERQAAGIEAARAAGKYKGRQPGSTKAKPSRAIALRKRGLTVQEIATALSVSERTVARYFLTA